MEIQKVIIFNGIEYRLMGAGKYYLSQSTTNEGRRHAKGLHVAIWEFYNNKRVPDGYQIHHKDGNTFNNDISNLECISIKQHVRHHFKKDSEGFKRFQEAGWVAAKEWHRSAEGREWHRKHGKEVAAKQKDIIKICKECGKEFYPGNNFCVE